MNLGRDSPLLKIVRGWDFKVSFSNGLRTVLARMESQHISRHTTVLEISSERIGRRPGNESCGWDTKRTTVLG